MEIPSAGAGATVRFGAVSNHTYSVLFSETLDIVSWTKLGDVVARPTNRVETLFDPGWTTNRYYRAVDPRQP